MPLVDLFGLLHFVVRVDAKTLALMQVGNKDEPLKLDYITSEVLVERLGAKFPKEGIYRSKMTPAIGTHTGPGLLLVTVFRDK